MTTRHPRRSHQQWQRYIDKYRNQSDLTQQQFCQREDLSLGTFRKHLYRSPTNATCRPSSQSKPTQSTANTGHFRAVTIRDSEQLHAGSCLELPGNIRLHMQSLPSAEYLHNLLKVFGHGH